MVKSSCYNLYEMDGVGLLSYFLGVLSWEEEGLVVGIARSEGGRGGWVRVAYLVE